MSDHVLVINTGSSSLKYSVVDARTGEAAASGLAERIAPLRLGARLEETVPSFWS